VKKFLLKEGKKLKEILETVQNFVVDNNSNVETTHYYILLGDKNLLQVIEETLNDPYIDNKKRKEQILLMSSFLKKTRKLYNIVNFSEDPEMINMKNRLEDAGKIFGFTSNNSNDIFLLELENTLKKLKQREIAQ
jgi:hypothetical protein